MVKLKKKAPLHGGNKIAQIQKKKMPIPSANMTIEKPVPVTNLKNPIVVVTDCSGMECPIVALGNLGVRIVHIASCDVDKSAKKFIIHNFEPHHYFDDIMIRDHKKEFAPLRKLGWLYVVAQCSKRMYGSPIQSAHITHTHTQPHTHM